MLKRSTLNSTPNRRLFKAIGPGLHSFRRGTDGKYYVLTPSAGLLIFDSTGKQLSVIGAPSPDSVANKAGRSAIAFGEDCDVDAQGNIYVADRGYNLINEFAPDGNLLRSFPVNSARSCRAARRRSGVTTFHGAHLITVYNSSGRVVREFGDPEELSTRPELNRYLSQGRLASDAQSRVYYGYTYLPEPRVRQYDRFGSGGTDFEFTGLGAWSEGRAARREIDRQDKRADPPLIRCLPPLVSTRSRAMSGCAFTTPCCTLIKREFAVSEYQIYTTDDARLEGTVLIVEQDHLLIGSDPLGIFEFPRPDRKH